MNPGDRVLIDRSILTDILDALSGLSSPDGGDPGKPCWCQFAIGHPGMSRHSAACENATMAVLVGRHVLEVAGRQRQESERRANDNTFTVDRRVRIGMDALNPREKTIVESLLRSKTRFMAYAAQPGVTRLLHPVSPTRKPLRATDVGGGLLVVFLADEFTGTIEVQDMIRQETLDTLRALTGDEADDEDDSKEAGP